MMFQLNPSARLRAVFVARRGDVAACRCAYRAGHDTPTTTGDKLMNNKILSFLTALGLAAACLATSSAFALGAFRIGGYAYVESGVTITAVVARAVEGYGAGDADAAFREAYTDCETVRSANTSSDLGGIPVTDDINTNAGDCNELSIHGNDRSSTNTETDTFTNECLIIVRAMINPVTDPFDVGNYGIGIEDTCQDALDTAIGDCTNCATAGGQEALLLNSEDHVYVRDGNALACNDNYYNRNASDSENMNPDVIIDCQKASLSSQCRINDPTKPIFDSGNGTCVAATETANFARDTDLYPNTCYESFILEGGTERGSGRGGAFPFPRFDNGECMPALECNIDGEGTTDRLTYGCTPCSDFNRAEEGQNACSLECLSQHVDTGMYVYIDPDTRVSTVVDADHLTAPVYTMCTPAECVDFNREDRAAAGDSCGVCLERFNDTDLEEGEACVPNEECLGDDDGIPDGAGGCTDPGTCPENSVEMGASCMCVAPFINNPNEGEFCVLSCGGEGEEGQIANGNQCIEIFYSINGNLVSDDLDSDPVVGTEEEPFDIALGDVADFSTQLMVTILNSDDEPLDIMYSKAADIEQQSAELIVSGEGVITFDPETFNSDTPDTPVSPGMYSIVVAVNSAEDATNPLEEEILLGAVYVTVQAPFEEPEPIIDDSEQPDLSNQLANQVVRT